MYWSKDKLIPKIFHCSHENWERTAEFYLKFTSDRESGEIVLKMRLYACQNRKKKQEINRFY